VLPIHRLTATKGSAIEAPPMMAFSTDAFPTPAEPALFAGLRDHFGTDPAKLPVVEQSFQHYHRPNLHLAVEEMLAEPGRTPSFIGIVVSQQSDNVTLAKLSRPRSAAAFDEGPVEYADVALAGGRRLACVKRGLYRFRDGDTPVALLVAENPMP